MFVFSRFLRTFDEQALRAFVEENPSEFVCVLFGRVCITAKKSNYAEILKHKFSGKALDPFLRTVYYYPGLGTAEYELWLQDFVRERLDLRVVGMLAKVETLYREELNVFQIINE